MYEPTCLIGENVAGLGQGMRKLGIALIVASLLAGCGGEIAGGSAGMDGSGGSAGAGGTAGVGGTGGIAGSGGTGGAGGASGSLMPGMSTLTIAAAGQSRSVILYVPASVSSGPLPLVIALHGNGDSASNFIATNGLVSIADRDGFVLAAPQGVSQSFVFMGQSINGIDWDAYRSIAQGNIDLPLLDAIRTQLGASGSIDLHRIFVFGYSQGGYLSFRYGMDGSAALSCAAVVAASNPLPGSGLVTQAVRKIPVAMQIGTLDSAISGARATRDELLANRNPVDYHEVSGAGHVPLPGDINVPLDFCRMQQLP